ncbi:RNA 2',3'-cyclic phosphodiesterase [uncultured Streptomyces sp.]|uniref:RNA 2',3'-cyclic phosphodiesterase n=1 Tax=uncultured Streptomyces sp. TaxID=174707 RepID=UPI00261B5065|nr:RNA 2',3'-cyclic phosphodiesterase [uncultured Streptomyces sp.]
MRLFAAVLPPPAAVEELRRAVQPLRALPGAPALRWTDVRGWHYTLAFFGEPADALLPGLYAELAEAARRTAPFALRVDGGGRFGGRALWAGASGEPDALRLLAGRTAAAAGRAGVSLEKHRDYVPHLTLARSRAEADLGPFTAGLADFAGTPWQAAALSLVRSDPQAGGAPGGRPRYEVVRAWPLGR